MVARRTFFVALLMGVFTPWGLSAQLASSTPYAQILDLYRAGETRAALLDLAKLTSDQIAPGKDALLKAFDSRIPAEAERAAASMRIAALVHTESAIGVRDGHDTPEWRYQIGVARTYVEKLASRDSGAGFPRTWWLLVTAYLQGEFALATAKEFGEWAHHSVGDDPELLLAVGATQEMGWTGHEADGNFPFNGDLKDAERAYRHALAAQPDLFEARLRLGRVLTLRGDTGGAVRLLAEIGESAEREHRYLARMFEGDAFERMGNDAEAERRYLAATALLPEAQSAHLGLAQVRHKRGARAEAAESLRATTHGKTAPDTSEPWFRYSCGLSRHTSRYLEELLAMVRP
jgi:tetratricopeptide (TPR) repeat protein